MVQVAASEVSTWYWYARSLIASSRLCSYAEFTADIGMVDSLLKELVEMCCSDLRAYDQDTSILSRRNLRTADAHTRSWTQQRRWHRVGDAMLLRQQRYPGRIIGTRTTHQIMWMQRPR